jgi:hypothetical protein
MPEKRGGSIRKNIIKISQEIYLEIRESYSFCFSLAHRSRAAGSDTAKLQAIVIVGLYFN